jgi:hypothetical protein
VKKLKALFVVAVLAYGFVAVDVALPTSASASIPSGCTAHPINALQIPQGPSPQSGVNSWRETGEQLLSSNQTGCGGVWMGNMLDANGNPSCGYFFASRFTPQPPVDWTPGSVCTTAVQLVNVCSTCTMRPGYSFLWYQAAGSPYTGPHARGYYLWYK